MSFLINFELDNKNALKEIDNFKKALADQQQILEKTKEVFGEFSSEYILQSGKVDEATKNLNDGIKNAAKNINDLKVSGTEVWEGFNKAFAGLKGGLGSLNGLLQLFGEQNEDVGAAMEKVEAVMEFTEGIEGIKNAGAAFKNFGSVLGEVASKGFGSIKTAIVETGIGALIIGLTIGISKLWDWISGNAAAKKAQEGLKESVEKTNEKLKDQQDELSNSQKLNVSQAKANGATEEQVFQIQQQYAQKNRELLQQAIKDKEESVNKFAEFRNRDKDSEKAYQDAMKDLDKTKHDLIKADIDYEVSENEHKVKQRDDAAAKKKADEDKAEQEAEARINKKRHAADEELEIEKDKNKNEEALAVANAKFQGKSDEEIFKIEQETRKKNIDSLNAYAEKLKSIYGKNSEEYKNAIRAIADAQTEFNVAAINQQTQTAQIQKEETESANKQREAILKQENDKLAQLAEADEVAKLRAMQDGGKKLLEHELEVEKKRIENLQISGEEKKKLVTEYEARTQAALKKIDDDLAKEKSKKQADLGKELDTDQENSGLDKHTMEHNAQLEEFKKWHEDRLAVVGDNEELRNKLEKEATEKRKAIAKQEADYKLGLTSNLLNQAADLLGKNTVAGKVAAIASATINTYLGATKALATLPPPFSYIQAALTVATGIKNIQSIINTQVPGQAGGGTAPSAASSPAAPLTPQIQQTSTQLNQDQLNQIGNATVRAFVLESDVSNNQEKIARLNRAARLGG
ncbi:MAG TPA: hypothetical protein VHB48_13845 [Chitinophagaceae bacterium]|nr:hypothetical protein [Chitinophagaceae bacterium]